MKKRELTKLGVPADAIRIAVAACSAAGKAGRKRDEIRAALQRICDRPDEHLDDPIFGDLAAALQRKPATPPRVYTRQAEYACWGDEIDAQAHAQMENACVLPVTVAAALMPDAHVGYGLPIGGVLATEGAVIPYAVGVDIACRVRLTVFDLPPQQLIAHEDRFKRILEDQTRFGIGSAWRDTRPPEHEVMDADWLVTPVTASLRDLAWRQLGTSGSGNHFVEFGEITFEHDAHGIPAGAYVAVVSHSGSRGAGAKVCQHYSRLAGSLHPDLPKHLQHLAWLPMDGEGAEYWAAMELMGRYAHANHDVIHRKIRKAVGARVLFGVENHHNYAWKETHGGREVIVHRKGATPAGAGVLGYIPGSMINPGYVVEGLGEARSLDSASHGAGRRLSRKKTRESTRWSHVKSTLREHGVSLLSAGLDEAPTAYKDIESVMRAQAELVRKIARFQPRIVKMAPDGERPED